MKRLLILFSLGGSLCAGAQGVWEVPEVTSAPEVVVAEENPNAPYLAGAVPEEDGSVVWRYHVSAPGLPVQAVYDRMLAFLQQLTRGEEQMDDSRVALVNKESHVMVAQMREMVVLNSTLLELDRTQMRYTLEVDCHDGGADVRVHRINYLYGTSLSGDKLELIKAENWITDKVALNGKGTKLLRRPARFRRKTVDRMNDLRRQIELALTEK